MRWTEELRALVEALKPFVKIAEAMFRPLPDGSERNRDKHGEAWGYNEAAITYDDFRRARTALTRAESSLASPAGMEGWMPIETAPKEPLNEYTKEGPTILLYGGFSGDSVRTGNWKAAKTNHWCDTALGRMPKTPTHWRHLPAAPRGESE